MILVRSWQLPPSCLLLGSSACIFQGPFLFYYATFHDSSYVPNSNNSPPPDILPFHFPSPMGWKGQQTTALLPTCT